jgi:hypothetical protein
MLRTIILTILLLYVVDLKSQVDFKVYNELILKEENFKFQIGQTIFDGYEIMNNGKGRLFYELPGTDKNKMTESKPVNITIRISGLNDRIIKNITLDYNDIDIDMAQFVAYYFGDRKFIVITVRYRFYIVNLSNYKVIGPLFPKPKGCREDAIRGSMGKGFKVFDNGQYLLGTAADFGVFCFNLLDLYHPFEIDGYYTEPPYPSQFYFYLDHRVDNIYNGIFVNNATRNIDKIDYLFKGFKFQQNNNDSIIKYVIDKLYLLLKQYDKEDNIIDLVIDYKNGRLLKPESDKDLINKLLNKINK